MVARTICYPVMRRVLEEPKNVARAPSKRTKMGITKTCKLTQKGLIERLPLLNLKAVCERAGVDYMRLANWQRGRVKNLREDELGAIAEVLAILSPNK